MDISKCLQGLLLNCSHRLALLFLAACFVAIFTTGCTFKKPSSNQPTWTCCKNNEVIISSATGQTTLPMQIGSGHLSFLDLDVQGTTWKIAALSTSSAGDLMAEISKKAPCPSFAVVRDQLGEEYLIIYEKDRQLSLSSVKHFVKRGLLERKNEKLIQVSLPDGCLCITVSR